MTSTSAHRCGPGPSASRGRSRLRSTPSPLSWPMRCHWSPSWATSRKATRRRQPDRDTRLNSMAEFIYSMFKARKAHGDKVILDNVTLAFLPGAKIGVVGPNGAGKSSVLRIMAGVDTPSNGEAQLSPGYTVGILEQEPHLDDSKNVLENVRDGV